MVLVEVLVILLLTAFFLWLLFRKKFSRGRQGGMNDALTGALNVEGLESRSLKYLSEKECRYAVVNMELANYRQLLHTFGVKESQRVLKHISSILRRSLSSNEPFARIDGGSFCFLLKNRQSDAIRARLIRIRDTVNEFNDTQPIPYHLELRFGIYIPKESKISLTEIRQGISALMESSNDGLCFCREEPGRGLSRSWEQLQIMEKSLANGDFVVYLQPKVRLRDDRVVGAEALIRWKHPEQGLLTPEMFVPLLEDYHLITRYDLCIFEQVCRRLSLWAKEGKSACPISVNLSHDTAGKPNFLDAYVRLAEKYGIAPELIEFELSRKLQQQPLEELVRIVEEIHRYGFRCALDRFGGSSVQLHLLRELNVDTVKLDHSFFSVENNKRRNRFVVEAVIKAAVQMQIKTVAEVRFSTSGRQAAILFRVSTISSPCPWTSSPPPYSAARTCPTSEAASPPSLRMRFPQPPMPPAMLSCSPC